MDHSPTTNPLLDPEALPRFAEITPDMIAPALDVALAVHDPVREAQGFRTRPWTVRVDGLCAKPGAYQLEDFLKPSRVEDRIYRMRCVEAWSMVIPWRGIPLADVIARAQPTSQAKFVEFTTLMDPSRMPGQRYEILDWPYVEGLRLDGTLFGRVRSSSTGPSRRSQRFRV